LVKKIKVLNLKIKELNLDVLEDILLKVERSVEDYLKQKLPPKAEYDLILRIDKNDDITLYIDIGVIGIYEDLIDYNKIIGDAINLARRIFEEKIKRYRRNTENNT